MYKSRRKWHCNTSNALTALFIPCGQDVACTTSKPWKIETGINQLLTNKLP